MACFTILLRCSSLTFTPTEQFNAGVDEENTYFICFVSLTVESYMRKLHFPCCCAVLSHTISLQGPSSLNQSYMYIVMTQALYNLR